MPHNKQAAKRVRTNEKARDRNKDAKSAMKTHLKKVQKAVETGNKTEALSEFVAAQQKIDKAAKNRVIHPNAAARLKSRLSTRIAKMGGA